jgi:hypothetical protein
MSKELVILIVVGKKIIHMRSPWQKKSALKITSPIAWKKLLDGPAG